MQKWIERLEILAGVFITLTSVVMFSGAVMLWFEVKEFIAKVFPG